MKKLTFAILTGASAFCPSLALAQDARPARPDNIREWAAQMQDRYPSAAIRAGEEGTVRMRLEVDAAGSVDGCTVTASSGSAILDEAACSGMREFARYAPALNDRGEPIPSTISQSIVYAMPDNFVAAVEMVHPVPLDENIWRDAIFDDEFDVGLRKANARNVVFQLVIDEQGTPAGCGVGISSGDARLDRYGCAQLMQHAQFEPARLPSGETVPGAFWLAHSLQPE
ncbi:TonB family protein [Aurantiacibacter aquimixticola]|uniref:TonB family protein n=1 Tax=Aurantiacibacter aquimixticola TaxID=1958945 RepID=A0A419RTJ8_9SPHN|nr:TonB family protein [Aurantiacibacter aquimixticola]RJY09106.1 TonB family protein [Aurantiacibacter aquimixticola]